MYNSNMKEYFDGSLNSNNEEANNKASDNSTEAIEANNNYIEEKLEQNEVNTFAKLMENVKTLEASSNASFDDLKKLMRVLQDTFDKKIIVDKQKEEIINRLHGELQDYKNDLYAQLLKPVFKKLISMIDEINNDLQNLYDKKEEPGFNDETRKLLEGYREDFLDLLDDYDVTSYIIESENFNPEKQKIIKSVSTTKKEKHKEVAFRVQPGFVRQDKIIRPELVSVYKYEANDLEKQ